MTDLEEFEERRRRRDPPVPPRGRVPRGRVPRLGRYPFTRSALATTGLARNCAMMALRCLRS